MSSKKYFWYCLNTYCSNCHIMPLITVQQGSDHRDKQHGCSVPINIWSVVTDPDWRSLSVMVTELKEDHQHRTPLKGEKSKTSPLLVNAYQRTVIHTHTLILPSYIFWASFYLRFSTDPFHVLVRRVRDTCKHPQETRICYKKGGWYENDFHVYNLQG